MRIRKKSKISQMNRELLDIAQYRSLKTAKYTLSILLLVIITYCMLTGKDSISAFYILAGNHLFPGIIRYLITSRTAAASSSSSAARQKKEAEQYLLPFMVRRYQYSMLESKALSMTFLLNCLFLFLWQQRMLHASDMSILAYVPIALLCVILIIRVIMTLLAYLKMRSALLDPNGFDH